MIQERWRKLLTQVKPPEYVFKTKVYDNSVIFTTDKSIDTSNIDVSDPITKVLVDDCLRVMTDSHNNKFIFDTNVDVESAMLHVAFRDLMTFLEHYMPQQNPRVTKLYRWFKTFIRNYQIREHIVPLWQYIKVNTSGVGSDSVHVKNGLALMKNIKSKYEDRGLKLGEGHGRQRRSNRW